MATASLPPRPHPTLLAGRHQYSGQSNFPAQFMVRRNPNPSSSSFNTTIAAVASSSSSSWELEEQRWLREEQRWLREEQRWLREERRWSSERDALLREIAALRVRLEALERELPPIAAAGETVLMAAKERRLAAGPDPEMVLEGIRIPEAQGKGSEKLKEERKTLRVGSEGDDVRAMQEALQRLGFYSGEEDMEYSAFSHGTERAVKTWQASLGVTENGIMTQDLLEKLFVEGYMKDDKFKGLAEEIGNLRSVEIKDDSNGCASGDKFVGIQETVIKEALESEIEVSQHRVFLLGENRWEEPSRLGRRDRPLKVNKAASPTQCLTCRGEGRLMCTECDGTGEPNIEPQFLEWIDEGAKCPYCEGLGYTICDV
ncbi:hypothetical protein AXF42_Ash001758 [Apostasia shenzhenica]|uniref:Peptidoglycan binding-like domain-containing protein n=1 Tax=Apostasia shenzhenica TaxID=1088818 RepID=A0A2I0AB45_9ASPA|nr:hypothetical protein AXF42_Ash001758 [Apostasia shenzhenica]